MAIIPFPKRRIRLRPLGRFERGLIALLGIARDRRGKRGALRIGKNMVTVLVAILTFELGRDAVADLLRSELEGLPRLAVRP